MLSVSSPSARHCLDLLNLCDAPPPDLIATLLPVVHLLRQHAQPHSSSSSSSSSSPAAATAATANADDHDRSHLIRRYNRIHNKHATGVTSHYSSLPTTADNNTNARNESTGVVTMTFSTDGASVELVQNGITPHMHITIDKSIDNFNSGCPGATSANRRRQRRGVFDIEAVSPPVSASAPSALMRFPSLHSNNSTENTESNNNNNMHDTLCCPVSSQSAPVSPGLYDMHDKLLAQCPFRSPCNVSAACFDTECEEACRLNAAATTDITAANSIRDIEYTSVDNILTTAADARSAQYGHNERRKVVSSSHDSTVSCVQTSIAEFTQLLADMCEFERAVTSMRDWRVACEADVLAAATVWLDARASMPETAESDVTSDSDSDSDDDVDNRRTKYSTIDDFDSDDEFDNEDYGDDDDDDDDDDGMNEYQKEMQLFLNISAWGELLDGVCDTLFSNGLLAPEAPQKDSEKKDAGENDSEPVIAYIDCDMVQFANVRWLIADGMRFVVWLGFARRAYIDAGSSILRLGSDVWRVDASSACKAVPLGSVWSIGGTVH